MLGGGTPASLAAARDERSDDSRLLPTCDAPQPGSPNIASTWPCVPSRFPETHSLVLDSCVHADVPVLAAGIGALDERLRELRAGWSFDPAQGAAGLARELERILRGVSPLPSAGSASLPTVANAALAHCALYAQLASR